MKFIASLMLLYRPRLARVVVSLLQTSGYRVGKFLKSFWGAEDLSGLMVQPDVSGLEVRNQLLRLFIALGSLAQLVFGVIVLGLGASGALAGGIYFGVALIISYPIVWSHLVLFAVLAVRIPSWPKAVGKAIVLAILARQVRQLRAKYNFKIIAVAGSVGKTSTKFAIAQTLESKLKVAWQQGNYNDPVSVPLVFFGREMPNIINMLAWLKIFRQNASDIKSWNYNAVVLELGTDKPGDIEQFSKYLKADVGVLTAIAPEHLEFFGTLKNVASEELTLAKFSHQLLINTDLCADEYLAELKEYETYGFEKSDWQLASVKFGNKKHSFDLKHNGQKMLSTSSNFLNQNQLYGLAAACAAASELGFSASEIKKALAKLEPVNGRLKPLPGVKNATILDDSYNSAPEAALAALETLYKIKAPQKIAILGSMNELGNYSEEAHRLVGEACDPKKIDLVVTVGTSAKEWLAPIARQAGCKVASYDDPVNAGKYVKKKLKSKALVLVKGSQNGVFAEEAVKILLKNKADASQLVRQSPTWLAIKAKQFTS